MSVAVGGRRHTYCMLTKRRFPSTFDIQPLGGVLQQGLIGYVTVGVNMSASYEAKWNPSSGRGA